MKKMRQFYWHITDEDKGLIIAIVITGLILAVAVWISKWACHV